MTTAPDPIYVWKPSESNSPSLLGPLWLTWLTILIGLGAGIGLLWYGFAEYEPINRIFGALLMGGSGLLLVIHLLGYHPDNHLVWQADNTLRWRLSRAEAPQSFSLDDAVAMRHRSLFPRTTIILENGREYVLPTRNIYDSNKRAEFVNRLDEKLNQPATSAATA